MKNKAYYRKTFSFITKTFISLIVPYLIYTACVKIPGQEIPITLSVSKSSLSFSSSGEQQDFIVSSNDRWTVSNDASSWLTISTSSGSNNGTISVTTSANSSTSQRTATITVNSSVQGVSSQSISVTQAAASPALSVAPSTLNVIYSSGEQKLTVTSNTGWSISSNQPWCTVQPNSGNGNRDISVTVSENTSTSPRTATLTFTAGNVSRQVTVEQQASPTLIISTEKIEATYQAGNNYRFTIMSNFSWTISSNQPWCTVQPTSGSGGREITVSVTENTTTSLRTAILNVTAGNLSKQVTVEQNVRSSETTTEFGNSIIAASSFGGGTGTQSNPFQISNAQQLKKLVNDVNNGNDYAYTYFRLTTNIRVTADEWIPIGNARPNYAYGSFFSGIFDGNDHTISGSLKSNRFENFGFFGKLNDARISNLTIAATVSNEINTESHANTGAIAGESVSTYDLIINCQITGTVTGGNGWFSTTGGIIGWNSGEITNCAVLASAKVTGGGGLSDSQTGGIVGWNDGWGNISNCTNNAAVVGNRSVGGIAGQNSGTIHTGLNTGNLSGSYGFTGGLVGWNSSWDVYSCCTNRGTVNGQAANANNQIGYGDEVVACPDGHTKR